jgi:CRISPR-associated protein Cas1
VKVEVERETRLKMPLLRLSGIVVMGRVTITPFLIQRCAEDGRGLVWLDQQRRFKARVEGETRGNVLLRRAQHLAVSDATHTAEIARQIVAGKMQNSRQVLLKAAREDADPDDAAALTGAAQRIADGLTRLRDATDVDEIRGIEGTAARTYFDAFEHTIRADRGSFAPDGRTKRPPLDRTNSVLSFLYALVRTECSAALEGVGLDPQVGFLHVLRPGRPSLALDLMEEFRPVLADRLAITLINRRQLKADHFEELPGGAIHLTDEGRKVVIVAYQKRKEEEVNHRVLKEKVPVGLVPHIQARLLARHLRGDLKDYPPFISR